MRPGAPPPQERTAGRVEAYREGWERAVRTTDRIALATTVLAVAGTGTVALLAARTDAATLQTVFLSPGRGTGGAIWTWDVPTSSAWRISAAFLLPLALGTLAGVPHVRARRHRVEQGLTREGGVLPTGRSEAPGRSRRTITPAQRRARADSATRQRTTRQWRYAERRRAYPAPVAITCGMVAATLGTWWVLALVVAWAGDAVPVWAQAIAGFWWLVALVACVVLIMVGEERARARRRRDTPPDRAEA